MSDILNTILVDTFTKRDLLRRIRLMREYLESVFFQGQKESNLAIDRFFKSSEIENNDLVILKKWSKEFFSEFNSKNLYSKLDEIKHEMKGIDIVTVYLSFDPTAEYVNRLCEKLRSGNWPNLVADIRFDPQVIGGCALVWSSSYHDFSMPYYLEREREFVLDLISKYTND